MTSSPLKAKSPVATRRRQGHGEDNKTQGFSRNLEVASRISWATCDWTSTTFSTYSTSKRGTWYCQPSSRSYVWSIMFSYIFLPSFIIFHQLSTSVHFFHVFNEVSIIQTQWLLQDGFMSSFRQGTLMTRSKTIHLQSSTIIYNHLQSSTIIYNHLQSSTLYNCKTCASCACYFPLDCLLHDFFCHRLQLLLGHAGLWRYHAKKPSADVCFRISLYFHKWLHDGCSMATLHVKHLSTQQLQMFVQYTTREAWSTWLYSDVLIFLASKL